MERKEVSVASHDHIGAGFQGARENMVVVRVARGLNGVFGLDAMGLCP
jgi:hypothetical protein